ncbi:MAG: hypothetical protein KAJ49_03415 [Arcobacteraceae bacterium]|nr:hypothetical protein [Arcobacteraceae bacterium]
MKKKKTLFEPNPLEQNIQRDFSAIISSAPSVEKVKKLLPKIKQIETKLKERKAKKELGRYLKQ